MKLILFCLILAYSSNGKANQESAEYGPVANQSKSKLNGYLEENHGLGVMALPFGIYHDYNVPSKSMQLHSYLRYKFGDYNSQQGRKVIETSSVSLGFSARTLNKWGFFYGLGLEYSSNLLDYDNPEIDGNRDFTHQSDSSSFLFDIGWQGKNGYYFQIFLSSGFFIKEPDKVPSEPIANFAPWRRAAKDSWESLTKLESIILGFGWYLRSS